MAKDNSNIRTVRHVTVYVHGCVQEDHEMRNMPLLKTTKLLTFFSGKLYEL